MGLKKILAVRLDRLGDLILSIPALETLSAQLGAHVVLEVAARSPHALLLQSVSGVSRVHSIEATLTGRALAKKIQTLIGQQGIDGVVFLQNNFWALWGARASGVAVVFGNKSPWFARLMLRQGVLQHRSQSGRHEAELGVELAESFVQCINSVHYTAQLKRSALAKTPCIQSKLEIPQASLAWGREWIRTSLGSPSAPFVLVHPGMGGSALNWPLQNYFELVERLRSNGTHVVVSAGPRDLPILEFLTHWNWNHDLQGRVAILRGAAGATGALGLYDLAAIMSYAQVVVAPSTGPLHLARWVGRPTVSAYSPRPTERAERWGPLQVKVTHEQSHPEVRALVLSPQAQSVDPSCMEMIDVVSFYQAVQSVMNSSQDLQHSQGQRSQSHEASNLFAPA